MTLYDDLNNGADEILDQASAALDRAQVTHYKTAGKEVSRARLSDLFEVLLECVRERDMIVMTRAIDSVARERYGQGVGLFEVQTAINVLEEAIWRFVAKHESAETVADGLARVSSILGAAKDRLGQTYVELASSTGAPAIDLDALARGATAGVG